MGLQAEEEEREAKLKKLEWKEKLVSTNDKWNTRFTIGLWVTDLGCLLAYLCDNNAADGNLPLQVISGFGLLSGILFFWLIYYMCQMNHALSLSAKVGSTATILLTGFSFVCYLHNVVPLAETTNNPETECFLNTDWFTLGFGCFALILPLFVLLATCLCQVDWRKFCANQG